MLIRLDGNGISCGYVAYAAFSVILFIGTFVAAILANTIPYGEGFYALFLCYLVYHIISFMTHACRYLVN